MRSSVLGYQPLQGEETSASDDDRLEITVSHDHDNDISEEEMDFFYRHRIEDIFDSIVSNISTINSYLAIGLAANSSRRFPEIREMVFEELSKLVYYICSLHKEIIRALALEAGTVGAEAWAFTTALVVITGLLLIAFGFYHLGSLLYLFSKKTELKEILADTEFGYLTHVSSQQIYALSVQAAEGLDPELRKAIYSIYFDDIWDNRKKLIAFKQHVQTHHLKDELIVQLKRYSALTPSKWQTLLDNHSWFRTEIARYRVPIAAMCFIPGLVLMIIKSLAIGGVGFTTLMTDEGNVVDQANNEALEIYPWMTASFPVILFQNIATLFYALTRFTFLRSVSSGFYNLHKPVERWAKDAERWLYYELGRDVAMLPAIPAIVTFAGIKSIDYGNRYSAAVGCPPVWDVVKSIVTDQPDPSGKCTTTAKANLMALLVGDSEFGKFYPLYCLVLITYYPLMWLIKKTSSLEEWLPRERAWEIYEKLKSIDKRSYKFAGATAFIASCITFYFATRFANHIPVEGLQVAYDIPPHCSHNTTLTNSTADCSMPLVYNTPYALPPSSQPVGVVTLPAEIEHTHFDSNFPALNPDYNKMLFNHTDNSTTLHDICPNADLETIFQDAIKNLPIRKNITDFEELIKYMNSTDFDEAMRYMNGTDPNMVPHISTRVINNATMLVTMVEGCPEYGTFSFFFLNLLGIAPKCSAIIESRTEAAFVTLFWMSLTISGGGALSLAIATLLLCWGISTLKNWEQGASLEATAEADVSTSLRNVAADDDNVTASLLERDPTPARRPGCLTSFYQTIHHLFASKPPAARGILTTESTYKSPSPME